MPRLDYLLLADYVRADHGLAHVIAAGIDTIHAPEVPTGQNVGLLARVVFTRAECGRPHRLEILFSDEDGQVLTRAGTVLVPEWQDGLPAHWGVGALTALNFGIPLPRYGLYQLAFMVNDQELGTINLRVVPKQVPPPQDDAGEAEGSEAQPTEP